ncbi:MAG: metallophosphoesterase [Rickettsiales bacterium]|nr:MAG: metallophosphoesterase [Rickettsiales bacterium]
MFTFWLLIFFGMFYFTSEMVYRHLLVNLVSDKYKYISHVLIIFLGQSFWLLLASLFYPQLKFYDRLFYFVFIIFFYMFFMVFCLKITSLFLTFNMQKAVFISCSISVFIAFAGHISTYFPVITRYKVHTDKHIKMKVALITDTHFGDLMMNHYTINRAIEKIKKENPDILIIGGDIVEGKPEHFDSYRDVFKNSGVKTFAVLGNHDYYRKDYVEGAKKIEEGDIKVLLDEHIDITEYSDKTNPFANKIILIGREDKTNRNRKSVKDLVKDIDKNKFLLLVDHQPQYFNEAIKEGIDLQLSGHTHNGQIFPFNFVVKSIYEKPYGQLDKEGKTLITSSGLGGWGPPIKIGSPVEVVIIDIE